MRLLASWFLLLALAAPAWGQPAAPLSVRIEEPAAGVIEAGLSVSVTARVSDPTVQTALLSVNGAEYEVPVSQGVISQQVLVVPGNNRIGVVVRRNGQVARDSLTFFLRGQAADLLVVVTWEAHGEIIDLWVREPGGETCKWDHRETRGDGRLLDFSSDAIGFGSEAYVRPSVEAGTFRIKVHYWGAYDRDDDRGWWAYRDLIDEAAPDLAALDRWAAPAALQTPVHVEAILFAGTVDERRWRFDVVLQRTGQLVSVGEVEITDAMIRTARARVQP